MKIDIDRLVIHPIEAAIRAGDAILKIYNSSFLVERKKDNSPLTSADKKSHEIISTILSENSGGIPLLSEEGKDVSYQIRKRWNLYWLIDPLDGTKEFIRRNGEFTVNIALIQENKPVLGVVYVPITRVLYYGIENLGSYRKMNAERFITGGFIEKILLDDLLNASEKLPINNNKRNKLRIVTSRSHLNRETEEYINRIRRKKKDIEVISSGSSIKICLVAEGSADIYPRFGPTMEWDTAAAHAITRNAGGEIFAIDKQNSMEYNKKDLVNPSFIAVGKSMYHQRELLFPQT